MKTFFFYSLALLLFSCQRQEAEKMQKIEEEQLEETVVFKEELPLPFINQMADSNFSNIEILAPNILQEIRYADTNNFTGLKIYECGACFLQNEAAKSLQKAQIIAQKQGYNIKVFDCYRAYDYQVKLYEAFPDFNFVAKPSKGSMHSLGCAVDLTLVDAFDNEVDMGTGYDSFDKKSYTYSIAIDSAAQANRKVLISIMKEVGFNPIKTEWWHFSYIDCDRSVADNLKWDCPE